MSCLSAFSKEALSGEARTGIYYDSPLCVFACLRVCVCVCVCDLFSLISCFDLNF